LVDPHSKAGEIPINEVKMGGEMRRRKGVEERKNAGRE